MKELSIEEKAKAYDEAIKIAMNHPNCFVKDVIEEIFPVLKESEDEKIRKEIIKFIQKRNRSGCDYDYDLWIAWLKKQGDQKLSNVEDFNNIDPYFGKPVGKSALEAIKEEKVDNANKVEPKFYEGDWTVSNLDGKARRISEVHFDEYNSYYVVDGKSVNLEEYDRLHHLWTLADAKDGDVLVCNGNIKNSNGIKYERICLFNNIDNAFFTLTKTSNFVEEYDIDVNIDYPDNTVPATKEQKEILFMEMKEAGYEWDADKKELKKIEQNPAWSEEDEKILKAIHNSVDVECLSKNGLDYIVMINWLKSLKDRCLPAKQEWSEEDERLIEEASECLRKYANKVQGGNSKVYVQSVADRVESLRPQTTWKPSDEQIKAVRLARSFVTDDFSDNPTLSEILTELEEQLKKLKE